MVYKSQLSHYCIHNLQCLFFAHSHMLLQTTTMTVYNTCTCSLIRNYSITNKREIRDKCDSKRTSNHKGNYFIIETSEQPWSKSSCSPDPLLRWRKKVRASKKKVPTGLELKLYFFLLNWMEEIYNTETDKQGTIETERQIEQNVKK